MELKSLLSLYRRWWWLLLAGLVLGLAAGLAVGRIQKPVYEASAKVLVTRTRPSGSTDVLSMNDQQLVLTYLELLKTPAIMSEAGQKLGTKVDPRNVNVDLIPDTQIIQVKVQDGDANRAAGIANALVATLVEQNESLQGGRYTAYENGLTAQISQVQTQIDYLQAQVASMNRANVDEQLREANQEISDLQKQITALEQEIATSPEAISSIARATLAERQAQLDQLRQLHYLYQQIRTNLLYIGKPAQGSGLEDPGLTSLQATLGLYRQLYLNLLNNLEAVKLAKVQSTPTVTEIERGTPPAKPIRPIPLLYAGIAGIVGLMLAAGAVHWKNYVDEAVDSSERVKQVLGLPVLAEIVETAQPVQGVDAPATHQAGSPFLNSFGILRISVSRLMAESSKRSILITSASLRDGKTTVAINLAAAFARAGKKVVLLDADFYKPAVHSRLGLENNLGLSNLLADELNWTDVAQGCGQVLVIPSGLQPPTSPSLLESERMVRLLQSLHDGCDITIMDGPPLFVADTQALASIVGGLVLVLRRANTTASSVRAMLDQLSLIDVNVLGVVLNRVPLGDSYYAAGYYGKSRPSSMEGNP